ncbi:uncharacterized protein CELE_C16D9.3 [Caenorhabditis elegans]|uniref:Uncharacterized protein n=1 Tax=Caenorhabditis elegans TaxID=6239 RepID=Q22897_CAEEL|nr:Uncharacterized protein CELE_C16D9.3 [Caenorhabditis elegans]CCD64737.1 Uncharacterized protein CELE_C16D9.3 [Caenorhabditis elegans]|eukprot:NP_505123.2 Uncharacterized protein CELE_C16D9.3 [Caenorhabditis elegans]
MKMIKPDVISKLFKEIASKRISDYYSSLISFRETDHSNFDVLHPDLLSYFPSDSIQLLQQERQIGPGNMFVVRTKYTLKIVKWWVLCSLTENCMNPPGSQLKCHFDKSRERLHANCYRYDQSVVNLLLLNDFKKIEKYLMRSLINSFERIH